MQHLPIIPPSTKNRRRSKRNPDLVVAIASALVSAIVTYLACQLP